ncbi:MAG TPA: GNAT family N-acetyltransferase [Acidimicrobiales bacterium]|nr:GNAT family N-acetyltransferase [Acidimicrobiales bacterium]
MTLTIVPARGELLDQWREVHNRCVAPTQLTADDVAERAFRHSLTVGYVDGVLVANATVRAPEDGGVVTVIVRVLPEHRRRGLASEYLGALLRQTRASRFEQIKTVILADNVGGLNFAVHHGFVETSRHEVDGVAFVDLTLRDATV